MSEVDLDQAVETLTSTLVQLQVEEGGYTITGGASTKVLEERLRSLPAVVNKAYPGVCFSNRRQHVGTVETELQYRKYPASIRLN